MDTRSDPKQEMHYESIRKTRMGHQAIAVTAHCKVLWTLEWATKQ